MQKDIFPGKGRGIGGLGKGGGRNARSAFGVKRNRHTRVLFCFVLFLRRLIILQ